MISNLQMLDAIIDEIEELADYGPVFNSIKGQRLNQLTCAVITYHERTHDMRRFYLRTKDAVKNYFDGRALCPHGRIIGAPQRDAYGCIKCLRELVKTEGKRVGLPPNMPVACVSSQLVGDTVYYAISACSRMDQWDKVEARDIADLRLEYAKNPKNFLQVHRKDIEIMKTVKGGLFVGQIHMTQKPIKINILRAVAGNSRLPHHVTRAAQDWIEAHVVNPKPVH